MTVELSHCKQTFGWAARDESGVLFPFKFFIRETGEVDVAIKVLYCGLCHSDLHNCRNHFGFSKYPIVPGHEIIGVVREVGAHVTKFKPGDKVGVGCLIGCCHSCEDCKMNLENYCPKMENVGGNTAYGGFSDFIVASERFVFAIPDTLSLSSAAPLLCAGITVYSPLRFYGLDQPGMHVGVVGLGGLGHMAVKFAKAMGLKVTVISTSPEKRNEAIGRLGADAFFVSRDEEQVKAAAQSMDGIIDTVSGPHILSPYLMLLKNHGKLVMVGLSEKPLELPVIPLVIGRKMVCGSIIGGVKETQEMINFAAEHKIEADVEIISIDYINTAMNRLVNSDVRYRFVVDIGNTLVPTY